MRRALVAIVSMSVACGGSAPPPTHPATHEAVPTVALPTTTTAEPPKPEPEPDTVASADPCEGGQVDGDRGVVGVGIGGLGTKGGGRGVGGSGYGAGAGGGKPARNPPTVKEQPVTVNGQMDSELIRRIVKRHLNEIRFCYEKELVANPHLAGRVVAKFTIDKDGMVIAATAEGISPAVSGCIATAIRRWQFPKPSLGSNVVVTYPFQFEPGAD